RAARGSSGLHADRSGELQHFSRRFDHGVINHIALVDDGGRAFAFGLLECADETLVVGDFVGRRAENFVDDREVLPSAAEQVWRSVDIAAGEHLVVWRYRSAATRRALVLTLLGLGLVIVLWWGPGLYRQTSKRS
ncbi:hypothetical protein IH781_00945, partial [Patescibacteria group bacterium]|nr:hypothetical protein [Patescibacteria group bacterium]